MKNIFLVLILISSLFGAKIIDPISQYVSTGAVIDLVFKDNKLYSATDASCVDIFDFKTKKIIKQIKVSKITDFMGDIIDSKIYSVDVIKNKILILSQAQKGARRVHIYENGKLSLVLPYTKKLFIAKAKFLDENTILLGLLSDEMISYDINKQKNNYRIQISQSKFSNFVLNEKKDEVIIADESGDLKIHKTKDGSFVKELTGQNLDNVFQVDIKNGVIATAGQDRRVAIFVPKFNSAYYKTTNFLIYSVGLSPSGKFCGYASDENNNVTVFNTITKSKLGVFGQNKMTLSNILFINENEFFSASDDKTINFYKIK
jgi:hypothetical protein